MGASCTKDKTIKESVYHLDTKDYSKKKPKSQENPIQVDIPNTRLVEIQRVATKKHKLGLDNSKLSKESEVLKIIKQSNHDLEDADLIDKCFQKHIFMRNLESKARREVIKQMNYCFVPKDTVIFSQGHIGNYFYMIKEGKVDLLIDGNIMKTLRYGESFGELALLHGEARSGTIRSVEDTYMWVLERKKFKQVVDYLNTKNFEENRAFIQSIPIVNNMESETISLLASNLIKVIYDPGNFIIKEGEYADCIYVIKEGSVLCSKNGEVFSTLSKGEFFGLNAILLESSRTMNVTAKSTCELFCISVATLTNILGTDFRNILFLNFIKMAMRNSKTFDKLNSGLIDLTYSTFSVKKFGGGETVIPKGTELGKKIIIILEGHLVHFHPETHDKIKFADRGMVLFEEEISKNNLQIRLNFDLIADPDCFLVEADLEEFTKNLGGSITEIVEKSSLIEALLKVPLFKNFSERQINSFVNLIKVQEYSKGEKIIVEGEEGSKFYIVRKGKVDIYKGGKYTRTLNENEYFGEKSLFIREPRSATVIAGDENVTLYELGQEIFKHFEASWKDFIINRIHLQDDTIELNKLIYTQTLGKGNFGNVYLVTYSQNDSLYALKAIARSQIDQEQLHLNLEMERRILLKIDHPFIMKLVKSLKDEQDIYFLTEYIRGKELWDVIRDIGLLNKSQNLFYGCSIMLAVDYLHKRKIVYRDIKPENIIVAENGFIKIIDFGTAKEINDRTATIIGTPHYMAPEVILGEGYTFIVDFWSIGVCLYEFICGGVPFGESCDDPMDVYTAIVNNELVFPPFVKDQVFKNAIKSILRKSPVSRLGKLSQIKTHPYFEGFPWDNLESLNFKVPYVPVIPPLESTREKPVNFVEFIKKNRKKTTANIHIAPNLQKEYDEWYMKF